MNLTEDSTGSNARESPSGGASITSPSRSDAAGRGGGGEGRGMVVLLSFLACSARAQASVQAHSQGCKLGSQPATQLAGRAGREKGGQADAVPPCARFSALRKQKPSTPYSSAQWRSALSTNCRTTAWPQLSTWRAGGRASGSLQLWWCVCGCAGACVGGRVLRPVGATLPSRTTQHGKTSSKQAGKQAETQSQEPGHSSLTLLMCTAPC